MSQLKIIEIFKSIQGESTRSGLPCCFVRLAGCNLNCKWCDTQYARTDNEAAEMSLDKIFEQVESLGCKRVEITGGEPMCQSAVMELLKMFCDAGYETLMETNGSLCLNRVDQRVRKIIDVKCPSSGEHTSMRLENIANLTMTDELKFVIATRGDFDYSLELIERCKLVGRCELIFSPVAGELEPRTLAQWLLESGIDARLGLQLHKIIWPEIDRGV